jgi:hypothetical protein
MDRDKSDHEPRRPLITLKTAAVLLTLLALGKDTAETAAFSGEVSAADAVKLLYSDEPEDYRIV